MSLSPDSTQVSADMRPVSRSDSDDENGNLVDEEDEERNDSMDSTADQELFDESLSAQPDEGGEDDPQSPSFAHSLSDNMIDLDNNDLNYEEDEEEIPMQNEDSNEVYYSHTPDGEMISHENEAESRNEEGDDISTSELGEGEWAEGQSENSNEQHQDESGYTSSDKDEKEPQHKKVDLKFEGLQQEAISSDDEEEEIQEAKTGNDEEGEYLPKEILGEANAHEEREIDELEEGELRSGSDSDDGIPEIKGGLSPPTVPASSIPSYRAPSPTPPPPRAVERDREMCRFFLRGYCCNGERCRFRHSRDTRARVERIPASASAPILSSTILYNRHIPPPVGPPVPLLSTEFTPPPSLVAVLSGPPPRPPVPANADSAAWERGLKQARALVRKQKGLEEEEEKHNEKEAEGIEAVSPTSDHSPNEEMNEKSYEQPNVRRPIAARVVVEASYSVGTSESAQLPTLPEPNRLASRVVKPANVSGIPSLIDAIREQPILEPPAKPNRRSVREEKDNCRTLGNSNTNYDPWDRRGSNKRMAHRDERRKSPRHRNSSFSSDASSSPSGRNRRMNRRHPQRRSSRSPYRRKRSREMNRTELNSRSGRGVKRDTLREVAKKPGKRSGDERKKGHRTASASSVSSSELSFDKSKGERKESGRTKNRNRSGSSSSTSRSPARQKRLRKTPPTTFKAILNNEQQLTKRGPKTPPEPVQRSRSSSSVASSKRFIGNRDEVLDQRRRLERRNSRGVISASSKRAHSTRGGYFDEQDEAPAAYRINTSREEKGNRIERKTKTRSSSSSSTSSSDSADSSSSSSLSSSAEQEKQKRIGEKDTSTIGIGEEKRNMNKLSNATICSSEQQKTKMVEIGRKRANESAVDLDPISSESEDTQEEKVEENVDVDRLLEEANATEYVENDMSRHEPVNGRKRNVEKFMSSFNSMEEENDDQQHIPTDQKSNDSSQQNIEDPSGNNEEQGSSNGAKQNDKVQIKQRREELMKRLQSIEEAIARKKRKETEPSG